MAAWPEVDFVDNREGGLFTAVVHRQLYSELDGLISSVESSVESAPSSEETTASILKILAKSPDQTIRELASDLNLTTRAVEKQLAKLKKQGRLIRVGPNKGGHWEIRSKKK